MPPTTQAMPFRFVNNTAVVTNTGATLTPSSTSSSKIPQSISTSQMDLLIRHFFSSFLEVNNFSGRVREDCAIIASIYQASSSLYNAIVSVAALDISKRGPSMIPSHKPAKVVAVTAYRKSIAALQNDLKDNMDLKRDVCLWTPFFLGLFEV